MSNVWLDSAASAVGSRRRTYSLRFVQRSRRQRLAAPGDARDCLDAWTPHDIHLVSDHETALRRAAAAHGGTKQRQPAH
jgi:hypothetical protein